MFESNAKVQANAYKKKVKEFEELNNRIESRFHHFADDVATA